MADARALIKTFCLLYKDIWERRPSRRVEAIQKIKTSWSYWQSWFINIVRLTIVKRWCTHGVEPPGLSDVEHLSHKDAAPPHSPKEKLVLCNKPTRNGVVK